MWSYIKKQNIEKFIDQYPTLSEYLQNIILLETNDAYFVPRLFSVNFPSTNIEVYNNGTCDPVKINNIEFTGSLRDEQKPIVDTVIELYNQQGFVNGIIKARPGLGKTVLAVYLACILKIKTLIVVDNQNLMAQWIKAFLEFTNLNESNIGIIKQKNFGLDRPIIIAMAQTLVSRVKNIKTSFKQIDQAKIGLVIYDEVHATSSAPVFSKISLLFRTKNILGLSATPFQTGLAEVLMRNTIGQTIYSTKKYDLKPEYKLIYYKSNLDSKKIYVINQMQEYLHRKALYNKLIINSDNYKNLILEQVKNARKIGHKIIVICFTKIQVTTISDLLTNNGLLNKRFYGEERDINYDEDILVCTYSFAGKGFDYKQLSCLILACPLAGKKSLIQVVGRVLRSVPNKLKPVVIDIADMSIPSFTIPEVRMKKKIIFEEFNCVIEEIQK